MSSQIYGRRQIQGETRETSILKVIAWTFLAVFAAVGAYYNLVYKPREIATAAAANAAYQEAISRAPRDIEAEFKRWAVTTEEKGVALKWSGAESEILYIRYSPAWSQKIGGDIPAEWSVWARSKSGRIFVVKFWLDDKLQFVASREVKESLQEYLIRALILDNREDLVKKLNLPLKPA